MNSANNTVAFENKNILMKFFALIPCKTFNLYFDNDFRVYNRKFIQEMEESFLYVLFYFYILVCNNTQERKYSKNGNLHQLYSQLYS